MAKKSKKLLSSAKVLSPGMTYVYYDKRTGKINSITNQLDESQEHGIEVPVSSVSGILSGIEYKEDFLIGYDQESPTPEKLTLIKRLRLADSDFEFKNNMVEWISETNDTCDCIIKWNNKINCWLFSLSDDFKKKYQQELILDKLVFFVTLETDFDFLIRTIVVDFDDLLRKEILVQFDSPLEKQIDRISISSKIVLKSYKLIKIYE